MAPDWLFMQDSARIHTARKVKAWFEDYSISVTDWPPYSPDMNPIEHAWAKLKETIYKLDPDFESFKGTKEEVTERFLVLIQRSWEVIGQDYFHDLVRSMDSRINAVISAKGWYTKY
jgi:transposase